MASETLTLDEDRNVNWTLHGGQPTHHDALETDLSRSNIAAYRASIVDLLGLTAPAGQVATLTRMELEVKYLSINNGSGAPIGVEYKVQNGGDLLGAWQETLGEGGPYTLTHTVDLTGSATDDLELRIRSLGIQWDLGEGDISIYHITPTLVYETSDVVVDVDVYVSSGEFIAEVESGECDLVVSSGEADLSVESGEVDLAVSSGHADVEIEGEDRNV